MSNTTARHSTAHPDNRRSRPEWQRLATYGGSVLSDRELLALLIGATAPRCNVHALVEQLLIRFGSINAIARAHPADLTAVTGLGPATAARLTAAFELARRATTEPPPTTITTPHDVAKATRPFLLGRTRERIVVVICNRLERVLGHEVLSDGAADLALLPIRETLAAVLRRDGQAFALAHNHPSGDPTPSDHDIRATAKIQQAAQATGLRLISHVVVTDTSWRTVPGTP